MTLAGLPITMLLAGTAPLTTEPAETITLSPSSAPANTTEFAPIQAR